MAELTSAEDVAGALASVAGTTPELLGRTLAERELLLVLDNFEHVLGAAPLLAELLAAAPRLRLLVTSQLPLRLGEEHTFVLEGLTERSAVELLLARAKQTSRGARGRRVRRDGVGCALSRPRWLPVGDRAGGGATQTALAGRAARAATPLA